MGPGKEFRVFDRESWRRKVRLPEWQRRDENEKHPVLLADRKVTEKW